MPYAKIWTDIENDEWFISLPLSHRGAWLQSIVRAKSAGDSGRIVARSWSALGYQWGCDGRTARKIAAKFQVDCKVTIFEENGIVVIEILKYKHWQELTEKDRVSNNANKLQSTSQNAPKQSRAEQTKAEHIYSDFSSEVRNLTDLLRTKILSNKPDRKYPKVNSDDWKCRTAKQIDLMIRKDNRSIQKIREIIIWCQEDDFWMNNILSGEKLRKQFDQLEVKMNQKGKSNEPYRATRKIGD